MTNLLKGVHKQNKGRKRKLHCTQKTSPLLNRSCVCVCVRLFVFLIFGS